MSTSQWLDYIPWHVGRSCRSACVLWLHFCHRDDSINDGRACMHFLHQCGLLVKLQADPVLHVVVPPLHGGVLLLQILVAPSTGWA